MQLLVSVRDAHEALLALEGGADVIDAKEPGTGALGPVALPVFDAIISTVAGRRPVSAALGDLIDERTAERDALAFARAGAAFVKVGFAGIDTAARAMSVSAAAAAGAATGGASLVVVAYADHAAIGAPSPDTILRVALHAGAHGVLIDTAVKNGPSLLQLVHANWLRNWVRLACAGGLLTAVAGRLTADELPQVAASGADIAGVRGAACEQGRNGQVSAERVRRLRAGLQVPMRCTTPREALAATSFQTPDQR